MDIVIATIRTWLPSWGSSAATAHTSPDKEKDVELGSDVADSEGEQDEEPITRRQQILAVTSAFFTTVLVLGTNSSFGIFQHHYGSDAASNDGIAGVGKGSNRTMIAAIGALSNGGIVSALFAIWFIPRLPRLRKNVRWVCCLATIVMALSWFLAAMSTKLEHLLFTQGLLSGLGAGILFNVVPTILPEYFDGHSGWAQGIAAAGSSVGGLIFPPLFNWMLEAYGTRVTLAIIAAIVFVLGVIISCTVQPARMTRKRQTTAIPWAALKDPTVLYFIAFTLLVSTAFRAPMAFGPSFSSMLGYKKVSSYLLAAMSGIGIVARPLVGWGADKVGHQNAMMLSIGLYALIAFSVWLPAAAFGSGPAWIVYTILCGTLHGSFLQLASSVAQRVFGEESYYAYSGAFLAIRGVGFVVGNPICGALVKKVPEVELQGSHFYPLIVFNGVCLAVGALCLAEVRRRDAKREGWRLLK